MFSSMTLLRLLTGAIVLIICIWLLFARDVRNRRSALLPPGPPGEPILGHLRIIPENHPEYQYTEWGKEYDSDILYFTVLGRPMVVLNSIEAAHDLLDKRGANYADRPRFVLFEIMGWGVTLTFLRYGPRFKLHRKLLQSSFTPTACKPYRLIQQREARQAVKAIAKRPHDWEMLLRQYSTAVILQIGFGIELEESNDPYVKMALDVEEATGKGGVPGSPSVDFFPVLRHAPNWLARWFSTLCGLEHARRTKRLIQHLHDAPWDATEPSIRAGTTSRPSFMRTHLEMHMKNESAGQTNEATIADLKGAAGAISIAGGNTTWSTIVICVLNLLLLPNVQQQVQAELDAVVGTDRLPTFEDRDKLRFLEYSIQETLRWAPLSPVGIPHAALEDDVYKGYLIPRGSVVFANAHAMTHDKRYYCDPNSFKPARYTPIAEGGQGEPFPEGPFGFGRRICPRQHLALSGVYVAVATLLATMDLRPTRGQDGSLVFPVVKMSNGLSNVPESFECVMVPRPEKARQLLLEEPKDVMES